MRKIKSLIFTFLIFSILPIIGSCKDDKSIDLDKLNLYFGDIKLFRNQYEELPLRPTSNNPLFNDYEDIIYEIEDETVCEIDENGIVHYLNSGLTTVNARYANKDYSFLVYCQDTYGYESGVKYIVNQIENNLVNDECTLFIGDSFFEFWRNGNAGVLFKNDFKGYNAFNFGISGSETHHWRPIIYNVISELNPKNVVINIGINNINNSHESFSKVSKNLLMLFEDIHYVFPNADIYYYSLIKGTGGFASSYQVSSETNKFIQNYMLNRNYLHYLDLNSLMIDDLDTYLLGDGLHPSEKCYRLFKQLAIENIEF